MRCKLWTLLVLLPFGASAATLTPEQMKALSQEFATCWSIPAVGGLSEMSNFQIKVQMNPDATLADVTVVDQDRYSGDADFRTVADSAVRAILKCGHDGLPLPLDDYASWSEFVVTFDLLMTP